MAMKLVAFGKKTFAESLMKVKNSLLAHFLKNQYQEYLTMIFNS